MRRHKFSATPPAILHLWNPAEFRLGLNLLLRRMGAALDIAELTSVAFNLLAAMEADWTWFLRHHTLMLFPVIFSLFCLSFKTIKIANGIPAIRLARLK